MRKGGKVSRGGWRKKEKRDSAVSLLSEGFAQWRPDLENAVWDAGEKGWLFVHEVGWREKVSGAKTNLTFTRTFGVRKSPYSKAIRVGKV